MKRRNNIGLDNGIIVKGMPPEDIPSFVLLPFSIKHDEDYIDIAYWRKCWGFRNMVMDRTRAGDNYKVNLSKEDLQNIIDILKFNLHQQNWEDSIWEYDEYIDHNIQQYINMSWLRNVWDDYQNIEVYWYDSY